ncbi:superoxide dismutase family protein [Streptomyces boninensis]|uniref:superoxide dismutase family protein n=1 Tax=Streptomyces boninensis TaxID=2039455 RepID=UPI003B2287A3
MATRHWTVRTAAFTAGVTALAAFGWAPPAAAQSDEPQDGAWLVRNAEFEGADSDGDARTYDPALVPEGSEVAVVESSGDGRTGVVIALHGMKPNRMYGVHVHTGKCGPKGDDAGPHYQNRKDPETPSVDPEYANRKNEVWLDLHTDPSGYATASAKQKWLFRDGEAQSVVLHEHHTSTKPGEAGTAGDRLACVNVPFE